MRILEGHPFLPVGSSQQVTVDVRVIAAANQDLQAYVRQKKFREDLYYRLAAFELIIPPLRDRGSDIEMLVNYFFDHFRRQHGRTSLELAPEARQKLLSYNWPGNVRQLRNVIDSAVLLAGDNRIEPTRPRPARRRRRRRTRNARPGLLGTPPDRRSPQTHQRQRPRSRQAPGHRPRHAVSQNRRVRHQPLALHKAGDAIAGKPRRQWRRPLASPARPDRNQTAPPPLAF